MAREYKPDADHARHLPARHRRLARPRPAQERHRDPAHPGLRRLDRGGARAGAASRARSASSPSRSRRKDALDAAARRELRDFVERPRQGPARRRPPPTQRAASSLDVDRQRRRARASVAADARRAARSARASAVDCLVVDDGAAGHDGPSDVVERDRARSAGSASCRSILYGDGGRRRAIGALAAAATGVRRARRADSPERLLDQTRVLPASQPGD